MASFIYKPEGKPDKQVLEQFFDGTLPTPCELDERAKKLADEQTKRSRRQIERIRQSRRSGL
jgi:UTP-glucose-1-phosphate uridylyltransferase